MICIVLNHGTAQATYPYDTTSEIKLYRLQKLNKQKHMQSHLTDLF